MPMWHNANMIKDFIDTSLSQAQHETIDDGKRFLRGDKIFTRGLGNWSDARRMSNESDFLTRGMAHFPIAQPIARPAFQSAR